MKKFLPAMAITVIFAALMVSQLVINGQELSASQTEKNKEQFSLFQDNFSKFTDTNDKGEVVRLTEIKKPIVIINFWASWCKPCIAEFKTLNALLDRFPEDVFILGINNDTEDAKKKIAKMNKEYSLKFNSIPDEAGKYADKFKIMAVPSTIVFHNGKVIKFLKKEYDFMSDEFISLLKAKLK